MRFDGARTTISLRAGVVTFAVCCCVPMAEHASAVSWLVSRVVTPEGYAAAGSITSLAIDAQGDNVIAGVVGPSGFPGIDSASVVNAGAGARFVARYDATTNARQSVAAVGAPWPPDTPALNPGRAMKGLALDAGGNAYLPAYAASLDFPAVAGNYVAAGAAALFRVSPQGQVTRIATLDAAVRSVRAVALDPAGNLYLTGSAGPGLVTSAGAPYGPTAVAAGCVAPFATKLDRTGQAVVYATYLGYAGTQGERCGNEYPGTFDPAGYAIAADAAGNAYVTGQAEPGVRATAGAVDLAPKTATLLGSAYVASHAFLTKIDPTGTALVYSARMGGNSHDRGTSLAIDAAGNAYVGGKTTTYSFPQPGTAWPQVVALYECLLNTPELGFLAKFSADGTRLLWAGLLPAAGSELDDCVLNGGEAPVSIALDAAGNVLATGFSVPSNRPTTLSRNAMQPSDGEGFFAQVDGGGNLLYSSWLSGGSDALAIDPDQNVRVAGYPSVTQISAGGLPVEIAPRAPTGCAGTPLTIDAQVAAAGNSGTVDFQVDGAHVGSALVRAGAASLSTAVTNGVRRINATYHGAGPFDGYGSLTVHVAVDQAGACN
jgi:hypothetical protein